MKMAWTIYSSASSNSYLNISKHTIHTSFKIIILPEKETLRIILLRHFKIQSTFSKFIFSNPFSTISLYYYSISIESWKQRFTRQIPRQIHPFSKFTFQTLFPFPATASIIPRPLRISDGIPSMIFTILSATHLTKWPSSRKTLRAIGV